MPRKSTSPEAAQKRVWKAELKDLTRNRKKILGDGHKARIAAVKRLRIAEREYSNAVAKIDREVPKATKSIDRRIAILEGRIGA